MHQVWGVRETRVQDDALILGLSTGRVGVAASPGGKTTGRFSEKLGVWFSTCDAEMSRWRCRVGVSWEPGIQRG